MKKSVLAVLTALSTFSGFSQEIDPEQAYRDSIESTFSYQHGNITLRNGIGVLEVPPGFKYLDPAQAERVLVDLWGNPRSADMSMGMMLPEKSSVMDGDSYVFNIEYDEMGYVKDDDADDIDYNELLTEIQKETEEANAERTKLGYEPVIIVGWASAPFYDKDRKILHWAKEAKFGSAEVNTLNYNVRVLGRKGVLILNAIAQMPALPAVKQDVSKVLDIVKFNEGFQYKDFDPSIDQVAAWTIGGLVAGKILAKVGILALILKFWKLIILAIGAVGAGIWQKIKRKKEAEPQPIVEPATPSLPEGESGAV